MKQSITSGVIAIVLSLSTASFSGTYSDGDGSAGDPYQIATKADLLELAATTADYSQHFILTADIDLAGQTFTMAVIARNTTTGYSFAGTPFSGTFNGSDHTISNLHIVTTNGYYYFGLFGNVGSTGTISNLKLEDVNITGSGTYIGGLVGYNNGTLTGCDAAGSVSGNSAVGGLVGWNKGTLSACNAAASVASGGQVGGLVGVNNSGSLIACYATGSVAGSSTKVGGLIGFNYGGSAANCYATGLVNGDQYVGGLAGENWGSLANCYATGSVSGNQYTGGLVGGNADTITACFWDTQTSQTNDGVGNEDPDPAGATGKTTAAMQMLLTFTSAGWDFINTWQMPANDYPHLAWETVANPALPWQLVSNMMTARDQFTGCVIGDKIYVFGGNGNPDGMNLNSGEMYDINMSSWSSIASNTLHGIEELTGVSLNGKFYVFGGWGCDNPSGYCGVANFNEAYDPGTNTWTALSQKPTTTASSVAAVYDSKIYVFGGYYWDESPGQPYISYPVVEVYDPASDSWDSVTELPKNLMSPAIAVYEDSAYVIGGYDADANEMNTEVMVYHFNSDTWTRDYCTVPAEAARGYTYAGPAPVMNGSAYLIGGVEGTYVNNWCSDKFTVFDIKAKTWESGPALPEARCGHLAVVHNQTPYVIGGYADEDEFNRARSTVYILTAMAVDLTGEYWFGSLGADVSTNVPWGKRGTVSISGYHWLQEWDDVNGNHTFSSDFTTTILPDGSVNVNFPSKTYNVAWNGDVMIHADTDPDENNRLGIDLILRKAAAVQGSDVTGDYSFFGHWLNWDDRWDDVGWGDLIMDPNGTAFVSGAEDDGDLFFGSVSWTLDAANAMIHVDGEESFVIGEGGLLTRFWPEPFSDGYSLQLGYNFSIPITDQPLTLADIAGSYQTRFLESGPGGVPYTCGRGTCVIDDVNEILWLNAYYSDGEHEMGGIEFSVGPGNAFHLDDDSVPDGIISPDKNLIFIPEYRYEDPPVRENYDWLGGIFLIRNMTSQTETPSGQILWQAVKAPYANGNIYYAIQIRVTISDMAGCSLKGPNMAEFTPAQWVPQRGQWSLAIVPLATLSQLQQESLGTWQLKLTASSNRESVYSFTISGSLEDSEFLPLPAMIEPYFGDSDVIAEHYTLRWDPNGAQVGADALGVEITGNGFSYFSNTLDLSATSWDPGWLEIGNAYCKVGYADYRSDMIDSPILTSGPAINWESATASMVSGPYCPFTVKYSLDFVDDGRIDLSDLAVFCSHWLESAPSPADFDDDSRVEFEDFSIFAQHWLEDVNDIAGHVFEIGITTDLDYEAPGPLDDVYEVEVEVYTDDTVDRIEFTTPAGNTFEIPNAPVTEYPTADGCMETGREFDPQTGQYIWLHAPGFVNSDALLDYGDGLYTVTIHFVGGRVQQTTAWFGIPGTNDPIPQPTQVPVITSFNCGDTLTSPVTLTWESCTDTAAEDIWLGVHDEAENEMEWILPLSAQGLAEPLALAEGGYEAELDFEVCCRTPNQDGIIIDVCKYSESDYQFTVQAGSIADLNDSGAVNLADLVVLAAQWLQAPGDPSADIFPQPLGDGVVDLDDFCLFARYWLDGV